ncbi:Lysophospholipase L1 [Rhizobium tibeticum]|uniref:GDSL-like Lipase/Acylhydrolase n=1 Tax=Rhizobium tibeticum TaxID=501024 RepID=A0A1H8MRC7_9HYPH|nr:SGNH/GDSL hydrolase family protein [Rhizobium tibeticum]SEI11779.1 GDSL-like Lipase/Acylhydrolase [Rhizobium tibeticum]SEO19798.1 Lysophospholipase L1 [Rhizobium tibeticum]
MRFGEHLKSLGISGTRVFGDSITAGFNASQPHLAWPALFAAKVNGFPIRNHAIPGTILQGSRLADGKLRPDNGIGRFENALLNAPHRDAILILYGYNDARYTAAPDTMNVRNFTRDYAKMLEKLIEAGHAERLAIGSPPYIPDAGLSVGSTGFTSQTRMGFEGYVEVVRELSQRFSLFYAPVYESMKTHGDGDLASADLVHPSDAGHRAIFDAFINAVRS